MKSNEPKRIQKKDFTIRGYWNRKRIQGQENLYRYEVLVKTTGVVVKSNFSSKRKAEEWLSTTIRIANSILENGGC